MGIPRNREGGSMTDTVITFLMDLMINGGEQLHQLTDHKYIAELPRSGDGVLNGVHKTIVGVSILNSTKSSYFMSQIRGYNKVEISAQVSVLTGYGSNDHHCRAVVHALEELFQDASYVGEYRIFVNSTKWEIKPDNQVWMGNITLDITRFDPI
jgi:hypothetical protein